MDLTDKEADRLAIEIKAIRPGCKLLIWLLVPPAVQLLGNSKSASYTP